jgi:hypothetical protein
MVFGARMKQRVQSLWNDIPTKPACFAKGEWGCASAPRTFPLTLYAPQGAYATPLAKTPFHLPKREK